MGTTHAMSHADAAWLHMDRPTNLMVITSAMWFDTPIDLERLRPVIHERLIAPYPRFSQIVVEGLTGPHWEDDPDFDLDLHLHHLALPAPGDAQTLEHVVADLMSQPLDRSRPLWSFHLLDGYGDGCAIVTRMHHAIADGIALSRVMLGLTDDTKHARTARFAPASTARRRLPLEGTARELAHLAGAATHEATEALLHPSHLEDIVREGVADTRAVASLLFARNERPHALRGTLGAAQRVAWSRPIPLDDVKAAGRRRGVTINDVVVSSVAAAVAAHLENEGEQPQDVHAMVPFNLRPLDQPLPRDLGNRFGLVILGLPVGVSDAEERVAEAARRMRAIKESRQGLASYGILGVIGHTPAAVEARIVDIFSAKATMVLTNVPGPRQPVYLAGARAGGVLVWAPCSGSVGMSVSVFSYAGEITVGFMVNGRLTDEPRGLVGAFEAAMDELL